MTNNKLKIKVGMRTFTATLLDNNTTKLLKEILPIRVNLIGQNGKEKSIDLPKNIPANPYCPGIIQIGDLMLSGSHTLVLFNKTITTSSDYTKIGRINDTSGLTGALEAGNTTLIFELES